MYLLHSLPPQSVSYKISPHFFVFPPSIHKIHTKEMQYQAPQHEIRKRPIRITLVISRCPHQIISIPSPRNLTTTATMKQYQMGSNNMKLWKTAGGEVTYRSWLILSNSFLFCGLHWMRNEAVSTNCPTVALKPDRKALNGCFNPGAKRQPKNKFFS